MLEVIKLAAERTKGLGKLAQALGVRHQTFYSWQRVPAERVPDLERITGIPRHEIRPDLWPRPSRLLPDDCDCSDREEGCPRVGCPRTKQVAA